MKEGIRRFKEKRNATGALTFLESERDIPFLIKRVYYIYDVKWGEHRGFHAHKELRQYMICVHGSCEVLLEDSGGKRNVRLEEPSEGLYIGPLVWHEMYDFAEGTVLLVLASDYYNEDDYIRDYDSFIKYVKEAELI